MQSHVVASSRDKYMYVSRMGVRPIRTPIISIRMGSGGSETLPVHLLYQLSRGESLAKKRPAATFHRGFARSTDAYRSVQRESIAPRAQRARRPGFKSRYDGRIRLGRPRARTPWLTDIEDARFRIVDQMAAYCERGILGRRSCASAHDVFTCHACVACTGVACAARLV